MTVRNDYQVDSDGYERHPSITKARLENSTAPTATQPFAVKSRIAGVQLTGTILFADAGDAKIVGDIGNDRIYKHKVRNVLTYSAGAEATWGELKEGDPVFYDRSGTMPADVLLSTSPNDVAAAANPLFGFITLLTEDDVFPKGADGVASTQTVAITQVGAGG